MQNSMMIFIFFCFRPETPFLGKFGSKKSKLSVQDKTWYLDWFEYAEFNGAVHIFCFRPETPFVGKFSPKNQNCKFKFKLGT